MEPLVSVLWGHSHHWITFCTGTFNPVSQASGNKETLRFRLGSENHDSNFMTGNTIQTVFFFRQAQVSSLRSPGALCWVSAGTSSTDSQRPDCHRALGFRECMFSECQNSRTQVTQVGSPDLNSVTFSPGDISLTRSAGSCGHQSSWLSPQCHTFQSWRAHSKLFF